MQTDYIPEEVFRKILWTLMPSNGLALQVMMETGMRITDCLSMRRQELFTSANDLSPAVYRYVERKTGKTREVHLSKETYLKLRLRMKQIDCPSEWVFPGRDPLKHRTRQAVWKDLNHAAALYRVNGKKIRANLGTHTARKIYAVRLYHEAEGQGLYDPLHVVQADMNHKDPAVTFLYAMADIISRRRAGDI